MRPLQAGIFRAPFYNPKRPGSEPSRDADIPTQVQLNTAFHAPLVAAASNGVITEPHGFQQERVAMTAVSIGSGWQRAILLEQKQ